MKKPMATMTAAAIKPNISMLANIALPMANTTITKLTNTPGKWVCVIHSKTMDSRFNATIS
jgi:hypothetical protein